MNELPGIVAAWRRHVPDVTEEEVAALLPIVLRRHPALRGLVTAYRAGRTTARNPQRPPSATIAGVEVDGPGEVVHIVNGHVQADPGNRLGEES